MLRELHISGLGVIEDLDLEFHEGLNVLTGETGTGKTMVAVGLALALGARGDSGLVRRGASAARVQARFDAPYNAAEWAEDGDLVLARTIAADGKGSARVSGQIATASALAELGSQLVEMHGQQQAHQLITSATQTAFLDRSAGDEQITALAWYRDAFDRLQRIRAALDELGSAVRERERELDLLAYQVAEIESVEPEQGESEALAGEEARLGHVQRLLEQAGTAHDALAGDGRAIDLLGAVASAMEAAAELDPGAGDLAGRAGGASADLGELARDLRAYRDSLAVDPERLQLVRERIAALRGLQRKYGATDDDVLVFLEEARTRLGSLEGADERLERLAQDAEELETRATSGAARVSAGRVAAAPSLAAAIQNELDELGMPGARVEIAIQPIGELGPGGAERVEMRFAPGPGQAALRLSKTASGGELSRTMLACRSVLADLDDVPTLVFDEVDAGIGGEAGLAVGKRLVRLAKDKQVLVVTHLPQIACFADSHVRVEKRDGRATVQTLSYRERIQELSRMLAGLPGSKRAVSHAEELLTEAGRLRAG